MKPIITLSRLIKPIAIAVVTTLGSSATGFAACNLSPLGQKIYNAVIGTNQSNSTIPSNLTLTTRNQGGPIYLPPNMFSHFAEEMVKAQYEIDVQTFLFSESDAVDTAMNALLRLQDRLSREGRYGNPVVVRFTLDVLAQFGLEKSSITGVYRGLQQLQLDPRLVKVELATYDHTFVGSNHTKSGLIDGRIAFIGGANFDDTNDAENPAMDSAYMLQGEVLKPLQANFDTAWSKSTLWDCKTWGNYSYCDKAGNPTPSHRPEVTNAANPVPATACQPMITMTRSSKNAFNDDLDNPQAQGFLAAINNAQHTLNIVTPGFNAAAFLEAVMGAANRGVKVRAVVSLGYEDKAQDLPFQNGTNLENVLELYAAANATQKANLDIRWYSSNGQTPVEGNAPDASHLKYMSIDNQVAIAGSANMDTQSWNQSSELNVAADDATATAQGDSVVFTPIFNRSIPAMNVNFAPIANAGKDGWRARNKTHSLDGSGSSDPNGNNTLRYSWMQTAGPLVNLSNKTTATPSFNAPNIKTTLVFKLTVTDTGGLSSIDEVKITVF